MNALSIIDEIEGLVTNGKKWLGSSVIEEEEFFTQIQRLRAAIPQSVKETEDFQKKSGQGGAVVLQTIDEIERIVESGKGLMGKRLVKPAELLSAILNLRSNLTRALK